MHNTVYIIHRRDELRATPYLQEKAKTNPKIKFIWDTEVQSINGKDNVESLSLKNKKTQEESTVTVGGIFVYIGMLPNTELFGEQLKTDERGYLLANEHMETNLPGVYAAGDVRSSPVKQLTTAASDGTIAAVTASSS